jgi:circadian clock protein KaiB
MGDQNPNSSWDAYDHEARAATQVPLVLRLYVAGNTARSHNAIHTTRELCETYLPGRYHLEIVDIYQQPGLARQEQIVATPTLIKYAPKPRRMFIGDLSHPERLLAGLGIL